jgi:hypothetical protein
MSLVLVDSKTNQEFEKLESIQFFVILVVNFADYFIIMGVCNGHEENLTDSCLVCSLSIVEFCVFTETEDVVSANIRPTAADCLGGQGSPQILEPRVVSFK